MSEVMKKAARIWSFSRNNFPDLILLFIINYAGATSIIRWLFIK